MQHPTSGLMAPDQFIPLAEQTGLIRPLTFWVLEAAVRGMAVYRMQAEGGGEPLRVEPAP